MIYLKKFNENNFYESFNEHDKIKKFIRTHFFKKDWVNLDKNDYSINQDGSVDFFNIWNFHYRGLKLPFKINSIRNIGGLTIQPIGVMSSKHMTNLENLPEFVEELRISSIPIENLDGSPLNIPYLKLYDIPTLTSLEGGPESINFLIIYDCENLYTTGGWVPKNINTELFQISTQGLSDRSIAKSKFKYTTPILNIWKHFKTSFDFLESVRDYNYIRGNEIFYPIFLQACAEYEINPPKEIEGYIYLYENETSKEIQ